MASLTGTKIKNTYDSLLKTTDNEPLDGTLRTITDGLGNNSTLSLSTSAASVGGTLNVTGATTLSTLSSGDITLSGAIRNSANPLSTYLAFPTSTSFTLITNGSTKISASSGGVGLSGVISVGGTLVIDGDTWTNGKIMHTDDLNTYIDFPSNDNISLVTGGTQRLGASDTGVDITGVLDVTGSAMISSQPELLRLINDGGYISFYNTSNSIRQGYIKSETTKLTLSADSATASMSFETAGTQRLGISSVGLSVTGTYYSTDGDISLTNGKIVVGESISIANSIGAASFSSDADLLVIGDTGAAANQGMTIVSPDGYNGNIYFADGTTGGAESSGYITYDHNEEILILGSELGVSIPDGLSVSGNSSFAGTLYVDSVNDRVGVGNASPSAKLDVTGTLAVSGNAAFDTNTLFVDASNNRVGIGTSSPSTDLEVIGISKFVRSGKFVTINPNFGSANLYAQIDSDSGMGLAFAPNNGVEAMRIDASGNVGINCTPSYRLDVRGVSGDSSYGQINISGTGSARNTFYGDNSGIIVLNADEGNVAANSRIQLQVDGSEKMRIDSSGNVGIGTAPSYPLHIVGSHTTYGASLSTSSTATTSYNIMVWSQGAGSGAPTGYIGTGGSAVSNTGFAGAFGIGTLTSSPVTFLTNDFERMRIDSSGNVLIGSTSAVTGRQELRIGGTAGGSAITMGRSGTNKLTIQVDSGDDVGFINSANTNMAFYTNATERMRITSDGYLKLPRSKIYGDSDICYIDLYNPASGDLTIANTSTSSSFGNIILKTSNQEALRITSTGALCVNNTGGSSTTNPRVSITQPNAASATDIYGNSTSQGTAQNVKIVRHYPAVASGNKLIIPFIGQGNLNSTTIMKIWGHSARYNLNAPIGFTATIQVGHLTVLYDTTLLESSGNVASVEASGMNLEINFTTAYISGTSDGIFVTIEYMSNVLGYSIDVNNITMN